MCPERREVRIVNGNSKPSEKTCAQKALKKKEEKKINRSFPMCPERYKLTQNVYTSCLFSLITLLCYSRPDAGRETETGWNSKL
jgi:hypothetical protein